MDAEKADEWFAELRNGVKWRTEWRERLSLAFRVKRGRAPAAEEPAGDSGFYR